MDFSFTKQDTLFLQMIREFAEKEVKPLAAEVDEQERFPMETVQKMAKIGLMGIPIPTQYGGAGGTNIMYGMAVEELSRVCATTGVILSAHTSLCCAPILEAGTEEQKMKYLPKLASGEWIGAFGLTAEVSSILHDILDLIPGVSSPAALRLIPVLLIFCYFPPFLILLYEGLRLCFGFRSPSWHPGLVMTLVWIVAIVILGIIIAVAAIPTLTK